MTSPKIGAPEVFLLSTAVTSMFACATYSRPLDKVVSLQSRCDLDNQKGCRKAAPNAR